MSRLSLSVALFRLGAVVEQARLRRLDTVQLAHIRRAHDSKLPELLHLAIDIGSAVDEYGVRVCQRRHYGTHRRSRNSRAKSEYERAAYQQSARIGRRYHAVRAAVLEQSQALNGRGIFLTTDCQRRRIVVGDYLASV